MSPSMSVFQEIAAQIREATGLPFQVERESSVGGGCINSASVLEGSGRRYFVKLNSADRLDMFEAEAEGLRELAAARAVRVPEPVCAGIADGQGFLAMEHLPLGGGGRHTADLLGQQLAAQHRCGSEKFGWHRDNTIGATAQINAQDTDWVRFWRAQRLAFQFKLARERGYGGRLQLRGEELLENLEVFFDTYHPQPSLLHGDLWGGNHGADGDSNPVIFDPAVYYGDREADLAMTELFGGFGGRFYAAYRDSWPLDAGYAVRKTLYNLYHVLNHLNLFGGGYGRQAEGMIDRLISEYR